jgi:hypothetical protein
MPEKEKSLEEADGAFDYERAAAVRNGVIQATSISRG